MRPESTERLSERVSVRRRGLSVSAYSTFTQEYKPGFRVNVTQYLLQAAHEVVADWRPGQVGGAGTTAHVEEVIGAQHGVVLLGVACGGQDTVHRDGHLTTGLDDNDPMTLE